MKLKGLKNHKTKNKNKKKTKPVLRSGGRGRFPQGPGLYRRYG